MDDRKIIIACVALCTVAVAVAAFLLVGPKLQLPRPTQVAPAVPASQPGTLPLPATKPAAAAVQRAARPKPPEAGEAEKEMLEAVREGNVEGVKRAFQRRPNLKAVDHSGTVLHTLVIYASGDVKDRLEIGRMLISRGADVNARNGLGQTPAHDAASNYDRDATILKWLISQGADIRAADDLGRTPLHRANDYTRAALLLDHKADVNAVDFEGKMALHEAAAEGNKVLIALLLDRGADPKIKDKEGMTAYDRAKLSFRDEAADFLQANSPK